MKWSTEDELRFLRQIGTHRKPGAVQRTRAELLRGYLRATARRRVSEDGINWKEVKRAAWYLLQHEEERQCKM